jgi:hypothetical protein
MSEEDWGPKCPVCKLNIDRLIPIMQGSEHVGWKCAPCTHELTPTMQPIPLPCPFCGGPPKIRTNYVVCQQCYATGPANLDNINEAVAGWNKAPR